MPSMVWSPSSTDGLLSVLARRAAVLVGTLLFSLFGLYLAVRGGSILSAWVDAGQFALAFGTLDPGPATGVTQEWVAQTGYQLRVNSSTVSGLIASRLGPWLWLLGWTVAITIFVAVPIGVLGARRRSAERLPAHTTLGHVVRLLPVFLLTDFVVVILAYSRRLFNVDWDGLLVESPPVLTGLQTMPDVTTLSGFAIATKWALIPAALASTAVVPTIVRTIRAARTQLGASAVAQATHSRGVSDIGSRRAVAVWLLEALPATVGVIQVAALVSETAAGSVVGLSRLLTAAYLAADVRVLAGILLIIALPIVLADLTREAGIYLLTGRRRRRDGLSALSFPPSRPTLDRFFAALPDRDRLPVFMSPDSRRSRLRTATPALAFWLGIGLVLFALQVGAVLDLLAELTGQPMPRIPTLVSWETIPDADYQTSGGQWVGGFLGLSPAVTWALRLIVAEGYLLAVLAWAWGGVRLIRVLALGQDGPLLGGSVLSALRSEWRLPVGIGLLCLLVAAGLFAPATGPSMADDPTQAYHEQYVSVVEDGSVERTLRLGTVLASQPDSSAEGTAGPLEYDRYDRFHPFGVVWDLGARQLQGDVPFTRDLFSWWVRSVQRLLSHAAVLGVITGGGGLLLVGLGARRRVDGWIALASDIVALGPLLLGVLVVRQFLVRTGPTGSGGFPGGGNGPMGAPPDPFDLSIIVLGIVGALLVGRAVRNRAEQDGGAISRLKQAGGPAVGYAALAVAGSLVYVVIARVFARLRSASASPGPTVPALDPRAAVNHTWIDTALWYTSTLPLIATITLLVALALLGDGIVRVTRYRSDPEGNGAIEPNAGGGGV